MIYCRKYIGGVWHNKHKRCVGHGMEQDTEPTIKTDAHYEFDPSTFILSILSYMPVMCASLYNMQSQSVNHLHILLQCILVSHHR